MKIPFLELFSGIEEVREELDKAYARVMSSGTFILGAEVEAFEAEFAKFCGARNCVGVGSGLDALRLTLMAAGIGPGDEVIVPSNTCIATWLAVSACGGQVVPVEPDPETFNIDPAKVAATVTSRTRAIIPVHLYGQCADMAELAQIAQRHGVLLLADAAQAAGARFAGTNCGALGDATAFSFYPTKNLGALADGGVVVTDDDTLAETVRALRNYGTVEKNAPHRFKGSNSRLAELQAAFLRCKLLKLPEWNKRRQVLADRYLASLAGHPSIRLPAVLADADPVWHLFTIRVNEEARDALQTALAVKGIRTGVYYRLPPHLTPAYAEERPGFGPLPIAEQLAATVLSLPLHPHLSAEEADHICASVLQELEEIR